jgi:hypothetical protein
VLDAAPKSGSRLPLVMAVVFVLVLAGGAAWYFLVGPGAPVAGVAEPAVVAAPEPSAAETVAQVLPPESIAVDATDPPPALDVPTASGPDTLSRAAATGFDGVSDSLVAAIQAYQERARVHDGRPDCTMLRRGLAQVERVWVTYEAAKRSLPAQLDGERARRDLMLYSAMDSVNAHFGRSACPRL